MDWQPTPVDEARLVKALSLLDKHLAVDNREKWLTVLTHLYALGWHQEPRVVEKLRSTNRPPWYDPDLAEVVGLTAEAMRLFPESTLVEVVFCDIHQSPTVV